MFGGMSMTELVAGMKSGRLSKRPAAILALASVCVIAFLYIAHEVGEASFERLDASLLLALRNPADLADPIGPAWLAETMLEVTALGGYPLILLIMLAVIGLLCVARLFGPALFVFLSLFSGLLVSQGLKSFYARPRPDLVPQLDIVHTASFPSGHAMMATLFYLTLATVIARLTDDVRVRNYVFAVAILLSAMIGISRIFLGVHWPSDVFAGWALGVAWAALSWLAVSVLRGIRDRRLQNTTV